MIDRTSPIVGFVGGDPSVVPADPKRLHELTDYYEELMRLCKLVGFDHRILFAQAWHETAGFTSHWWRERLNPAGIGITGDATQNDASGRWANGTEAARAHVVHLATYVFPKGGIPNALGPYLYADPRRPAVYEAGYAGTVRTLGDLGNGKWATDPEYADKISARANAIFKELPMTDPKFGLVPYPAVTPSHLSADNPWINSGAPDVPEAVFWHRAIGSWEGTNGWFHAGKAATAYGVSVAATDGTGGKVYEWIAPGNGLYGESSGPAVGPYGDGQKLIERVGVNGVNRTTKAIEISGNYDTPLDEAARTAIVALTAYFADQRRVPWDQFPNVPGEDRSFVCWHNEITGLAYKQCPGVVVMNETSALIQRIAGVLKRYQVQGQVVTPKPPTYTEPDLPLWFADSIEQTAPGDNSHKGRKYYVARRNYVAIKGTRRMAGPDSDSGRSGPNVKVREKIYGERIIDNKWILTNEGHHVAASGLSPRLTVKPGS